MAISPTKNETRLLVRWTTDHTVKGDERLRHYFEALGRFVDAFARVETQIAYTLWKFAGVDPRAAKILFSGVRIDVGSTYIKQLAKIRRQKKWSDDLEEILLQLAAINKMRNIILHHGARKISTGRGVASDSYRAKGKPISFRVSPRVLDNMTDDLWKIVSHLAIRHQRRALPRDKQLKADLEYALQSPWRYIRPSLKKSPQKMAQAQPPKAPGPKAPGPKPPRQP